MNLIHLQCEMNASIEKPFSTGNFNKVVVHSLFTFMLFCKHTPNAKRWAYTIGFFCLKPVFCKQITSLYTNHSNYVRKTECYE